MTIEIRFATSPAGKRYALYRIVAFGNLVWQGMSLRIAEQALKQGHVSTGRLKGALAVAVAVAA